MRVDVRQADGVIIVDLKGRLVAGTGDELLHEIMNELVAEDWRRIVLDLTAITKIDSSGIGELVAGVRLAERFGSQVKLIVGEGRLRQILDVSRVLPFLDLYDEEAAALASFASTTDEPAPEAPA